MENIGRRARCQGRTKANKPCQAWAGPGGLCFFHANPNQASELGRKGGSRSKGQAIGEGADSLPTLDNAIAVRDTAARLFTDVYSGKLDHKIAAVLENFLSLQVRLIQMTDLEQRLAKVEKAYAEARHVGASVAGVEE